MTSALVLSWLTSRAPGCSLVKLGLGSGACRSGETLVAKCPVPSWSVFRFDEGAPVAMVGILAVPESAIPTRVGGILSTLPFMMFAFAMEAAG